MFFVHVFVLVFVFWRVNVIKLKKQHKHVFHAAVFILSNEPNTSDIIIINEPYIFRPMIVAILNYYPRGKDGYLTIPT